MPGFDHYVENPIAMRELLYSPTGPVGKVLVRMSELIAALAEDQVGYDDTEHRSRTGPHLKDTIERRFSIGATGPEIEVGSAADYALYNHDDTVAHWITPRKAGGKLVFWSEQSDREDGLVFRDRVWHPGTTGTHFLSGPMEIIVGGDLGGIL